MSNKQIHQLPELDPERFSPAQDSFIVQKPTTTDSSGNVVGGTTYKANLSELIRDPSVNLPGSTNWRWNFLERPAKIVGYHKINYNMSAFTEIGNVTEDQLPTSSDIGFPNIKNVSFTQDIYGRPTGVPKTAKSLMCIAFLHNCDLHLWGARDKPLVSSPKRSSWDYSFIKFKNTGAPVVGGWNADPVEQIFTIDNISLPKNPYSATDIEYNKPNHLSFELRFRRGDAAYVQLGGFGLSVSGIAQGIGNFGTWLDSTFFGGAIPGFQPISEGWATSHVANPIRDVAINLGESFGKAWHTGDVVLQGVLPNYTIGGETYGVDIFSQDTLLGQVALNALGDTGGKKLSDFFAFGGSTGGEKNAIQEFIDSPFTKAGNLVGSLLGKIPIAGEYLEPLFKTATGFELLRQQQLMAQLVRDPSFFNEYINRGGGGMKQQLVTDTKIAGWELFYIQILAWN